MGGPPVGGSPKPVKPGNAPNGSLITQKPQPIQGSAPIFGKTEPVVETFRSSPSH